MVAVGSMRHINKWEEQQPTTATTWCLVRKQGCDRQQIVCRPEQCFCWATAHPKVLGAWWGPVSLVRHECLLHYILLLRKVRLWCCLLSVTLVFARRVCKKCVSKSVSVYVSPICWYCNAGSVCICRLWLRMLLAQAMSSSSQQPEGQFCLSGTNQCV